MKSPTLRHRTLTVVAGVAMLAFSGWASADPPSRVARLGYTSGAVSFSPAGENDWDRATLNRPLTTGDRLWSDSGARAEIQVGGAMIRMNAGTSVSILNLDDRIAQLKLTQGILNVRVRRLERNQVFEVDTPNVAFTLRNPGEYRIEVDPDGRSTTIIVRKGQGEAYGDGAAYVIDSRQPYRFTGTGLREYRYVDVPRLDEFDRWTSDRDRRYDSSASARYVSQDVIGYQDLDANGTWRVDASYGNVWIPNRVAAGWAPYHDGHWAWVDPWGWTWMDDAPWGFAVSHFGRWANLRGTWGWVPGPVRTRAYYAPALVAFVGGSNFQLAISSGNVNGVAWFPLAPREVYRPSYPVSRTYFENVNRSNTVVNNTVINNYYTNTNVTQVVYANRQVPGAIVAVPTTAFVQSQAVSRTSVRISRDMVATRPVAAAAPVVPTEKSVHGAAPQGDKPPPRVFERPVVARTAQPAAHAGFAAQLPLLAQRPGNPLDDAARKTLRPTAAAPAPTPVVKVVVPAQAVPPTQRPPPVAPAAAPVGAPVAAPVAVPVRPTTPPASAAQAPEQRAKPGERTRVEERAKAAVPPVIPQGVNPASSPLPGSPPPRVAGPRSIAPPLVPPAMPQVVTPPQANPRQPVLPAPVTPAPPQRPEQPKAAAVPHSVPAAPAETARDQRGRFEQRTRADQRAQPEAQPSAPPQVTAPVPVPTPQPQRAAERRALPPQIASPARAMPPPPAQRSVQPVAPTPQVPSSAPAAAPQPMQRVRPEPVPAARQAEPRPPVAVPRPTLQQPAPKAAPRAQEPRAAASKPEDRNKDEPKRDGENRRQ